MTLTAGLENGDASDPARRVGRDARLSVELQSTLDAAVLELIAERAVELVIDRLGSALLSPFMTVPEAAAYLRCSRQRVDDLLSQGRLTRRKDGSRTLVERAEVDTYLGRERVAPALPLPGRGGS